ncbi:MAG: cupin domain-containing protein [Polynucleobacter sp.]|jgi:quercetin dioxygenase-like cupin family protein
MKFNQLIAVVGFVSTMGLTATQSLALTHVDGAVAYEDIEATEILIAQSPKTILGQDFKYPTGQPLIKAFLIDIPVGKQTSLHKHAVPLFVYVLSGELEVDYGSKGKKTFKSGTSYVEAIEWCHLGKASGKLPVKIIGVYLGQEKPDQIKPEACTKPN